MRTGCLRGPVTLSISKSGRRDVCVSQPCSRHGRLENSQAQPKIKPNTDLCSTSKSSNHVCRVHANVRSYELGYSGEQAEAYVFGSTMHWRHTVFCSQRRTSGKSQSASANDAGQTVSGWITVICGIRYCTSKLRSTSLPKSWRAVGRLY